jgi:hypothetical protein
MLTIVDSGGVGAVGLQDVDRIARMIGAARNRLENGR